MMNLLYILAIILIIGWAIGVFFYAVGSLIHLLLVVAVIAILIRVMQGKKSSRSNT